MENVTTLVVGRKEHNKKKHQLNTTIYKLGLMGIIEIEIL